MKIQISEEQFKTLKEGIRSFASTRKIKLFSDTEVNYVAPRFREHIRKKNKLKND
jgi:flagellar assembly factor FliW